MRITAFMAPPFTVMPKLVYVIRLLHASAYYFASNVESKAFNPPGSEEYSAAVLTGHVGVVVQHTLLRTL